MTLIVAHVTPLGVRVAGDMRVTDPNATASGFLHAALKVVLVSPTRCIGYAGPIGVAISAMRRLASDRLGVAETASALLEAHAEDDGCTDFVLATLRPADLISIKSGVAEPCDAAWIGDAQAYNDCLQSYHGPQFMPPPEFWDSPAEAEDGEVALRMSAGMAAVVHGPSQVAEGGESTLRIPQGGRHETVGEAVVTVVPRLRDGQFCYTIYNRAAAPTIPRLDNADPSDWGASDRGAFTYSLFAPAEPGVGAIGLYFAEGSLGVLYCR